MFTGIVQQICQLMQIEKGGEVCKITIALKPSIISALSIGDSVSVNGICLTAVNINADKVSFDVMNETVERTTGKGWTSGMKLNAELALRASDRLGGHIVQGHIDGTGRLKEKNKTGGNCEYTIEISPDILANVILKGSVAVDGVSLTVTNVTEYSFNVCLIPHTLKYTTLGSLNAGDYVNVETDVIGKYVNAYLSRCVSSNKNNITMKFLAEQGFV